MENTSLKHNIAEILAFSNRLVSLAKEAKAEAYKLHDRSLYEGAEYWANLVGENITGGITNISQAAEEAKVEDLAHAVAELLQLGRYVNDYDYTWYNKHEEISRTVGDICRLAGLIYGSINVFDPQSIESTKRALE